MPKASKKNSFESFYFTIDAWTRSYKFEINRHKWELQPYHHAKHGPERIGNVWTRKERIFCSAFVPSDAYFSLPACFIAETFIEMRWRVRNLWHGKGQMDALELATDRIDLESGERAYLDESKAVLRRLCVS